MRAQTRSLKAVPLGVVALLVFSLAAQILVHNQQMLTPVRAASLPSPPRLDIARSLSFGDDIFAAKLAMLWLQGFDNQPGISLSFAGLDYAKLSAWLSLIIALDPQAQYPLRAASRIYAEVADNDKRRLMLDFVQREFMRDPNLRWRWMAHAVFVAKHRMGDAALALQYARTLAAHGDGPEVPRWAKQMVIFVLEEMGELASAEVLLGGLLNSGQITDPHELRFLSQRLREIEERAATPQDK